MEKDINSKNEIKKVDGYIQVKHSFIFHQMDLKGSAVKIFLVLLSEVGNFGRNTKVKISNSELRYLTGIKDEETIRKGIRELAKKGWIQSILADIDNSYTYIITSEKKKPNTNLLEWLEEVGKKRAKISKKLLSNKRIIRGEKGRFQKADEAIGERGSE